MNPDNFKIQIDAESVQDLGQNVAMRVQVYGPDGREFYFTHPISLRSAFFKKLKESSSFKDDLKKICRARVREEMLRRIQANAVTTQDAVNLMSDKPE